MHTIYLSMFIFTIMESVFCSYQHIFSKYSIEGIHKKHSINHSSLIVCWEETCQIIRKFIISENNTLNCYDQNILILFDLNNKSKTIYNGFLAPNNKIIDDKQIKSENCKKIKR